MSTELQVTRDHEALRKFTQARRIVGLTALPLRDEERPHRVVITDSVITVLLSVERWAPVRGGVKITHRGQRWLSFERDACKGLWQKVVVSDTTTRLPEPELWLSQADDVAEQASRAEHEAMCYRPGTRNFPLDGPIRLAQQRAYGV